MKKKTIIALVVILLAIALVVAGIMAYFTDRETATNTFTIGNVDIELTEPIWEAAAATGSGNIPDYAQNLVPGNTVAKDPTVTNVGANDAFIFVKVEIPYYENTDIFTPATIDGAKWHLVSDAVSGNTHTYVYAYATGEDKADLTALTSGANTGTLFDTVTLTTNTTAVEAVQGNPQIVVTAYGIQTTEVEGSSQADVFALFTPAP